MLAKYDPKKAQLSKAKPGSNRDIPVEIYTPKNSSGGSRNDYDSPVPKYQKPNTVATRSQGGMARYADDIFSDVRSHQMQLFKEFDNFHKKVFKGFDDMFGLSPFGSAFGALENIHKEMEDMMSFSNIGNSLQRGDGPSRVISRSYVQSVKLDPQGRKYEEKYFSNNYAMRGNDGTMISERQQAYQNSGNNLQRIAEERMINDKGKKLVQERIKGQGPVNQFHHFLNMDESIVYLLFASIIGDIPQFDSEWDDKTNKLGFYNEFGKMLGYNGSNKRYLYSDYDNNNMNNNRHGSQHNPFGPKRGHTNDDPVNYNKDAQGFGRYRYSDIQPTQPGRALPMPAANQNQNRGERVALEEPGREEVHPQSRGEVRNVVRNEPQMNFRYEPRRGDGNFRNRNVQNHMPQAG